MKTKLGYACLNTTLDGFKTITLKKAKSLTHKELFNVLQDKTRTNFENLYQIMLWNVNNGIKLYRVSSNLCPLYTHDICCYNFQQDYYVLDLCSKIRALANDNNISLTIHPSQYVVINSVSDDVFHRSVKELQYHYELILLLDIKTLCLHVGGKVGGIETAKERFIDNFIKIPKHLQQIICLENDDKSFNVENTLDLCEVLDIPMIIDLHHDRCLKSSNNFEFYLDKIIKTWGIREPKCHLSSGREFVTDTKHAESIGEGDFVYFYNIIKNKFNVMFECKDKEQSIIRLRKFLTT